MPQLKAEQMLDDARAGKLHLTADGWHDLTLLVTGDKEEAERAFQDYVKRCYRAGQTPQTS